MHALPSPHGGTALDTPSARLPDGLRAAAACTLGLVLVCGPLAGGLPHSLALTGVLGLLLAIAALLWLASGALAGELRVGFGWPAGLYVAFLAFAVFSSLHAENWFAGLRWCLLMAVYGLAAFLTLQLAREPAWRRFLLACLAATGAALAAYALWHYALYMPALRRWLAQEPGFVLAATHAGGGTAGDLAARVQADRAYGSFITPNQMACFLAMVFFPLAGLLAATLGREPGRGRRAMWAARIVLVAALLTAAGALYLSRSKGGAVAFAFGMTAFAAGLAGRGGRSRRAWLAALVVAGLVVVAAGVWLVHGSSRLRASLDVRLGYWETSLRMARERPLIGVGPDSWPGWYSRLKEPEYEESRAAHNAYLQLLAETGAIGLLLWCSAWGALLLACVGGRVSGAEVPPPEKPADDGILSRAALMAPALAALALALDSMFVGTMMPPQHVPGWLADAPWLPYVLAWAVWTAVFAAALAGRPRPWTRSAWIGVAAGLGVFLVHSAGDFTLRVPAIGLAAAALAGLLLSGYRGPARGLRVGKRGATALLAIGVALTAAWSFGVTRPALTEALSLNAADAIRLDLVGGRVSARDLPVLIARVADEYKRACAAVPWDARAWRERAAALLWLAGPAPDNARAHEALEAARRAVDLDPMGAANWSVLSQAQRAAGDAKGALDSLFRAAELQPSLPAAWYAAGRAYEEAGRTDDAAAAYDWAYYLMPRQYHPRNRVPAGPSELARFWASMTPQPPPNSLIGLARDIAVRAGGVALDPAADDAAVIAVLAEGLEGGRQLVRDWPKLDERTRATRFYQVVGPQLWEWALAEKVRMLEAGVPTDAQTNGASGGT